LKNLTELKKGYTFVKSLKLTGNERYSVFKFKKSSYKIWRSEKRALSL